jgi:hypothetical protein
MKTRLLSACLAMTASLTFGAETKLVPVTEREGMAYVSTSDLGGGGQIAVKSLPGQEQIVVCQGERCAVVKDVLREGGQAWLSVSSVAAALGARAEFDGDKKHVGFHFSTETTTSTDAIARVGQLAPNFRLAKLDGTPVELADFRGKRVLINSWASW